MTNIFKRIQYTIEAELHNILDKKQQKNPIAMLNQYIREAEKKTKQTGELLKRQAELKLEMERQHKEVSDLLIKREQQLVLAEATAEQDLIDFAQAEVAAYTARKRELASNLEIASADYFTLEQKFEAMKHKIADMKVRQLSLMGKENVVRATKKMDKVIAEVQVPDYDEMEDYIKQLSTHVEQQHARTTLETRLEKLEVPTK